MNPYTYSFLDTYATISGPGGSAIALGHGAGVAEEGITIEFSEDNDTMQIGADGKYAHSLHASKAGIITVRLLKTSPTNALLSALYNVQKTSSTLSGKNIIVLTNVASGDNYTCQGCAFTKHPGNSFAKVAGMIDWVFNSGHIDPLLGAGV